MGGTKHFSRYWKGQLGSSWTHSKTFWQFQKVQPAAWGQRRGQFPPRFSPFVHFQLTHELAAGSLLGSSCTGQRSWASEGSMSHSPPETWPFATALSVSDIPIITVSVLRGTWSLSIGLLKVIFFLLWWVLGNLLGEASEKSSWRNTNSYTLLNWEGSFVVSEVVVIPFIFILHCAAVH